MRKKKLQELEKIIKEYQNLRIEKLEEEPEFLSIEKYKCIMQNGQNFKRERLLKNKSRGSAAVILPITKEKEVILVVQPRVFTSNISSIELPAGYQEANETTLNAAKRELQEETGYISDNWLSLGEYYQDQGISEAVNASFLALDCIQKTNQSLDQDEFIKYFKCSIKEAYELIDLGYIKDINTLYTMEKAKSILKRRRK